MEKSPAIKDEESYARAWWAWWSQLQPEWRVRGADGRPVPGGSVVDDWGKSLCRPGKNGVLMVLLALVWWKEITTAATTVDWDVAVQDVAWVLSQMARSSRYVPLLYSMRCNLVTYLANRKHLLLDEEQSGPPAKKSRK